MSDRRKQRMRYLLRLEIGIGVVFLAIIGFVIWKVADANKYKAKKEITTSDTTEITEETTASTATETDTEEPAKDDKRGPYATKTYTTHDFKETDNTVVLPAANILTAEQIAEKTSEAEEKGETFTVDYSLELTPFDDAADPPTADDQFERTHILGSTYMVLVDLDTDEIIAERDADKVIYPASMTKILTVLTASDYVQDLDDTFVITQDIVDYVFIHECSAVGYKVGDTATVRELFQGTMICSGADAALALAIYTAGSEEAFVELMNEKAKEIGMSDNSHFTNPVGIYDDDLHCTVKDMALLLSVAIQNDTCVKAMSTWTDIVATSSDAEYMQNFHKTFEEKYDTASEDGVNTQLDYGIEINNWFLRRIKDYSTNGKVKCAKTGFVPQSGNCCASYLMSKSGKHYICVTANAHSSWRAVFDHVGVYKAYTK